MRRWVTTSFMVAVGLLLTVEVVVRIAFARSLWGRFEYGYSATAGFVETPDGTVKLIRAGGRRFWPQKFGRKAAPGTLRIFVLGDSVPRGSKPNQAYGYFLQERLRQAGVAAEVINMGVGGNGARRTQIILRQVLQYQPGLVILHVNDSNEYEDEREWQRYQEFLSWHPRNWLMKSAIIRRIYEAKTEEVYWKWLPDEVRQQREINDVQAKMAMALNPEKLRAWDELVRTNTLASVDLLRNAKIPFLLISQTWRQKDREGKYELTDHGFADMVRRAAFGAGACLSMGEVFAGAQGELASLFADTSHLTVEGHRRMAEAILQRLRRLPGIASRLEENGRVVDSGAMRR